MKKPRSVHSVPWSCVLLFVLSAASCNPPPPREPSPEEKIAQMSCADIAKRFAVEVRGILHDHPKVRRCAQEGAFDEAFVDAPHDLCLDHSKRAPKDERRVDRGYVEERCR